MTNSKRVLASSLRAGDKVFINNQDMTVRYVSFRSERADKRAMSMMTRGRDLASVVQVDLLNEQGRQVSHEFNETELITVEGGK